MPKEFEISENLRDSNESRPEEQNANGTYGESSTAERNDRKRDHTLDFEFFGDPAIDAMISMNINSEVSTLDVKSIGKYIANSSNLSLLKLYEVGKSLSTGSKGKVERHRKRSVFLWAQATKSNLEILLNNSGASKGSTAPPVPVPIQLFDRVTPVMTHLRIKGTPTALLLCLV